jgi:polysaccharide biosynthesis/export protein
MTKGLALAIMFIAICRAPAQQETAQSPASQRGFSSRETRYRVRVGDTVEVAFRFTPEYNQTLTLQPDGYISLREADDVHAAGKTTAEIAQAIRNAYNSILRDPIVSVYLKDFEKPFFVAGGEVGKPGKYELRAVTSVTEGIQIAGGLTEKAKHSQVFLFRRVSDQWTEVRKLDVKAMLHSGNLREDLQLQPDDMIYVPRNAFSKWQRFIPTSNLGLYTNPMQ